MMSNMCTAPTTYTSLGSLALIQETHNSTGWCESEAHEIRDQTLPQLNGSRIYNNRCYTMLDTLGASKFLWTNTKQDSSAMVKRYIS